MPLDEALLKELIATFQVELREQTQFMIDGLLSLEKQPDQLDENTITTIFRAAHNIKGAARSIGVKGVGEIAHHVETIFSRLQEKKLLLTPAMIDVCLDAVDKMQLALQSFIDESPLTFDLPKLLSELEQCGQHEDKIKEKDSQLVQAESKIKERPSEEKNESIRVSLEKINKVATLMEEIQVSEISIGDQVSYLHELSKKIKAFSIFFKKNKDELKIKTDKELYTYTEKLNKQIEDLFNELSFSSLQLEKNVRARLNELMILSQSLQEEVRLLRLVPASVFLHTIPRTVRDIAKSLNKQVEVHVHGDTVHMDKLVLESLKDPLTHLVRNAIDHGIEAQSIRLAQGKSEIGHIHLEIKEEGNEIVILVSDDGAGIDLDKVVQIAKKKQLITGDNTNSLTQKQILELIFLSGFSTKNMITDVSGRGIGLDVVKTNLNKIKGSVYVTTQAGIGTTFHLRVPLTLSSERGLLVRLEDQFFILITNTVERVLLINIQDLVEVEGNPVILLEKRPIPLRILSHILNINQNAIYPDKLPLVIINNNGKTVALLVDEIVGEREIVIKPLCAPLSGVSCFVGGTLLDRNQVAMVIDSGELIQQALQYHAKPIHQEDTVKHDSEIPHILVVDDSITTRTLEKNILESKNYKVTIAVNGKEAWDLLQKQTFSLLITDVSMPIMDGFALTDKVKKSEKLRDLPVIIVTSLGSESEKSRGVEVGANAYLIKNEFESGALLNIVRQLV